MRITQYAIVFFIIFIPVIIMTEIGLMAKQTETGRDKRIDSCMAMSAAEAGNILRLSTEEGINDIKDEVIEVFFRSAYAYMGLTEQDSSKELFDSMISVICITDEKGYYLRYMKGGSVVWSEQIPYYSEDEDYIFRMLGGERCLVYSKHLQDIDGDRLDNTKEMTFSEMEKRGMDVEGIKRTIAGNVAKKLEESLTYYGSRRIGNTEGRETQYNIVIPENDNSYLMRSMGGRGIVVLYHHRTINDNGNVFIARSGIHEGNGYCVDTAGKFPVYHCRDCKKLGTGQVQDGFYTSKEECALAGAYACKYCIPFGCYAPS